MHTLSVICILQHCLRSTKASSWIFKIWQGCRIVQLFTQISSKSQIFNNTCELSSLELRKSASILSNLKNTAKRIFAFKNRLRYSRERAIQFLPNFAKMYQMSNYQIGQNFANNLPNVGHLRHLATSSMLRQAAHLDAHVLPPSRHPATPNTIRYFAVKLPSRRLHTTK